MPDPENTLIWIERIDPPNVSYSWSYRSWQNSTHVKRRAKRIALKYVEGWHCPWCEKQLPVWKRIDATYCTESCRKMAARDRRMYLMKVFSASNARAGHGVLEMGTIRARVAWGIELTPESRGNGTRLYGV